MKDFKSYSENQPNDKNGNGQKTQANPEEYNNTVQLAKLLSKTLNGKNEGQILQMIINEAESGKRNGSLTNADFDNFYNALSPLLDGMKKRKLKEVIARLKSI